MDPYEFNDVSHTQGNLPHLMQYLWQQFVSSIQDALDKRRMEGRPSATLQEALAATPAKSFLDFASKRLEHNRPVETFALDSNWGIRLADNTLVAVAPGTSVRGEMEESRSVPITRGRGRQGMEDGDAIQV